MCFYVSIGTEGDGDLINNKQEFVELFNKDYMNTVKKFSGRKPGSLGNYSDELQDKMTVKEMIAVYSSHTSIQKVKHLRVPENKFNLPNASLSDIN